MYNWQFEKWAEFVYNEDIISNNALKFAELNILIQNLAGRSTNYILNI